mmetsp:Transcript_3860/g.6453  ORF Transcript_3860/g.6453 Transcript_3860/m.6453 type:complete len:212 (+) Transcript_3860:127-762(+)
MMMFLPSASRFFLLAILVVVLIVTPTSHGFAATHQQRTFAATSTRLFAGMSEVESLLKSSYPTFDAIIGNNKNKDLWKKLSEAETYTLFVPSESAFESLGGKKVEQLRDDRNYETTEKVALFHAINEAVSADALFASGGVVTMGGEVLVGRSVKGGFFGVGGSEDGGVVVGGCKVTQSIQLEEGIVHEVDGLVSPEMLWRYMDQLRIPGSS